MDKKKIIAVGLLLMTSVLTPSICNCSNSNELSWSLTEETDVVAFEKAEHIMRWANEPWNPSVSEVLSTSDDKKVLVVTKGNGSFIIPTLFFIFLQQDSIYKLYAFSDNIEDVTGTYSLDLVDDSILVISDINGQIGILPIDFDRLSKVENILFLDRYIRKDKGNILASNAPYKRHPKPYFTINDYDCVVKGIIEERMDIAYFDGGFDERGGAISAIKVRVLESFGSLGMDDYIWIYPDSSSLGVSPRIWNYGYRVPSGPLYFSLMKKGEKYFYRLDDRSFVIRPEENGSIVGDFYFIDKLTPPNSRVLSSAKFERKLSKQYKHK